MKLDEVTCIGVVGAGQMGSGIAQVLATSGWHVLLTDVGHDQVEAGLARVRGGIGKAVEKGRLTEARGKAVTSLVESTTEMAHLRQAQLIIEAVTEDPGLKEKLFRQLGGLCAPASILASNTSSISISRLGSASGRPDRVLGIHFMNPVPAMRLVEVVRGRETSEDTITLALDLVKRLDRTAVVCNDAPGFIVNRILMPMINEAVIALEQGVGTAVAIDLAMTAGTNHPVGPLALADRIGLDTVMAICEVLHHDLGDSKFRPAPLLRTYVEAGWLGKKSGRGFYSYEGSGPGQAGSQKART